MEIRKAAQRAGPPFIQRPQTRSGKIICVNAHVHAHVPVPRTRCHMQSESSPVVTSCEDQGPHVFRSSVEPDSGGGRRGRRRSGTSRAPPPGAPPSGAPPPGAPGLPADSGVPDRSCKDEAAAPRERERDENDSCDRGWGWGGADGSHHNTPVEVTFLGATPSEISATERFFFFFFFRRLNI